MERIGAKEREYALRVLNSQFRSSTSGVMTKRLEEAFAKKFNIAHAIAFVNGTATLHSALAVSGIGPGDEVIVPPLTMSSTAFAVLHANAVPVFADIDAESFTIDPKDIRKKITRRTRAIIPVALYGLAADLDAVMDIAKEYNLKVIEDDAQCFLGRYKSRIVGTIGDMSSFSFQSSKHITSGEGGMVITANHGLADKLRRFSSLGYAAVSAKKWRITKDDIQDPDYQRHVSLGFNYRMPEICCAVALAQVERLEELVKARITAAKLYAEAVRGCRWLTPQKVPRGYKHSYWTYALKIGEDSPVSWHDFRKKYIEFGGDGIYAAWQLSYLEPVFRNRVFYPKACPLECPKYKGKPQKFSRGLCPTAESIQPRLLQLKTNYFDINVAKVKARALAKTIKYYGSKP